MLVIVLVIAERSERHDDFSIYHARLWRIRGFTSEKESPPFSHGLASLAAVAA